MKFTFKSYELKNNSSLRTKNKELKPNNSKPNGKFNKRGAVVDNRKYANDTTLSEAEKIARRIALENIRRKSSNKSKGGIYHLTKEFDNNDDEWEHDPFNLRAKQIDNLDTGVDESSDEDNKEQDTEKYFKKGKKTLDEIIRESKIEKYEKSKQKEKEMEDTTEVNEEFNKNFRFVLPKIGPLLNKKTAKDFQTNQVDYGEMFQKHYETLIYAPKLPKADVKSILAPVDDKDKDKIITKKIKRLREHLAKDGIVKESNSDDEDAEIAGKDSATEDDEDAEITGEESETEDDEDEVDEEEDGEEEDESEDVENTDDGNSEECSDDEVLDEDNSEHSSEDVDSDTGLVETNLEDLKKLILTRNKTSKRQRRSDESDPADVAAASNNKKARLDQNSHEQQSTVPLSTGVVSEAPPKTEIECLRTLLQMPDLRQDAIVALVDAIGTDLPASNSPGSMYDAIIMQSGPANFVGQKLVLITLLYEALSLQTPDKIRYSPELIRALKCLLATVLNRSLDTDMSAISRSSLTDICSLASDSSNSVSNSNKTISELWHIVSLLSTVIGAYRPVLTNTHALLVRPLQAVLGRICVSRYPTWLAERIEALGAMLVEMKQAPIPVLRMKRRMRVVRLLEADLIGAARHDPRRDVTKALKLRVKQETRNARRDLREEARLRVTEGVNKARKEASARKKKTAAIIHGINQS